MDAEDAVSVAPQSGRYNPPQRQPYSATVVHWTAIVVDLLAVKNLFTELNQSLKIYV
jgi:hypothetical protein